MKKRLAHTENILKDKIQGHEFPFDPDAWSSMQQLLDQSVPSDNLSGTPRSKRWTAVSITRWAGYFGLFALLFVAAKYHIEDLNSEKHQTLKLSVHELPNPDKNELNGMPSHTTTGTRLEMAKPIVLEGSEPTEKETKNKALAKNRQLNEPKMLIDDLSILAGLTEDSDHPGTEKDDTKYSSSLFYHLLGIKPIHTTFESINDFAVPEDAVQAPKSVLELQEFAPEQYKTEKAHSRSILLPKIENWQERAKKIKPATSLQSPQAVIINKASKSIELGLVVGAQAMSLERSRRDTRVQPTVGLSISAPIGKRLSAEMDVLWKNVSGYHFYASFVDSGYANGGYSRWEYSVASEEINFFEIPVAIKYSTAHKKQNLLAGVRFSRVKPNDYIQYYNVSNALQPMEDYIGDIGDGFRRWDAALFLGADVRLWKNLWLDIRYSRGLHDLTDNTYFKNTRIDIASDAQVTLKYNFINLKIPSPDKR